MRVCAPRADCWPARGSGGGSRARRTDAQLPVDSREMAGSEDGALLEAAHNVGRAGLPRCRKRARVVLRHARANQLDIELLGLRRRVRCLLKDEIASAEEHLELGRGDAKELEHLRLLRFAEDRRALREHARFDRAQESARCE